MKRWKKKKKKKHLLAKKGDVNEVEVRDVHVENASENQEKDTTNKMSYPDARQRSSTSTHSSNQRLGYENDPLYVAMLQYNNCKTKMKYLEKKAQLYNMCS